MWLWAITYQSYAQNVDNYVDNSLKDTQNQAKNVDNFVENTIKKVMKKQESCWNTGDIHGFMEGYWKSENLRFMGKNGITYGWQKTLDRYLKRYPDKATMGQLNFEIISTESLAENKVLLLGSWKLMREKEPVGGYFSLIWQQIDGQWVIIFDHTS